MDNALPYRLTSITLGRSTRFLFQKRDTLETSVAMSLYEVYLSKKHVSQNTVKKSLTSLRYLYTFSNETGLEIEQMFLSGESIPTDRIRAFSFWLSRRVSKMGLPLSDGYYNDILLHCKLASHWFIKQFGSFSSPTAIERKMLIQDAITADANDWHATRKKVYHKPVATDLDENEIFSLECYFRPETSKHSNRSEAVTFRNYIIWRLAIEMGLRRGEILALRIKDCPSKFQPFLKVVRIEERGFDYIDPRGPKAPRPKTLSRDLGFILSNSPLPALINTYITRFRLVKKVKHGKKTGRVTMPPHDFLFISHRDGSPLSYDSLEEISKRVKKESGVSIFHWHLVRHAFFNRAYLAAATDKQSATRLKDLVQYGGWSDESSLDIYSRRARRDRARQALVFWQSGATNWKALELIESE